MITSKITAKVIAVAMTALMTCVIALTPKSALASINQTTLKVLSFNTWLLSPLRGINLSQDNELRKQLIPIHAAATEADVILLQEVWLTQDKLALTQAFGALGYPYSFSAPRDSDPIRHGLRGAGGDGLLTVSKVPLVPGAMAVLRFSHYTRPDEYFAAKGAHHLVADLPCIGAVDVYNSHAGAVSFDTEAGDFDLGQALARDHNLQELKAWISTHNTQERPRILALDSNVNALTWNRLARNWLTALSGGYVTLMHSYGLRFLDSLAYANGPEVNLPSNNDNYSTSSSRNDYARRGMFSGAPDQRLDYIFIDERGTARLRPAASRLVFDSPVVLTRGQREQFEIEARSIYLSDHFGVLTEFQIEECLQ